MPYTGVETNLEAKAMKEIGLIVMETETVNTVVKAIAMEIVQHLVKSVKNVERKTTLKSVCRSSGNDK